MRSLASVLDAVGVLEPQPPLHALQVRVHALAHLVHALRDLLPLDRVALARRHEREQARVLESRGVVGLELVGGGVRSVGRVRASHPGTRCRDYWITERKFAARNGSKRKKKKRTGEGYFKQVSEKLVTYHDEL